MRTAKTKPLFDNIDLSLPLPIHEMQANVAEDDCFGKEWEPGNKMCSICSEMLVCGSMFNNLQSKMVKKREISKGGYLDSSLFDDPTYADVLSMLAKKPMTRKELVDRVERFTKCPDRETVVCWVNSFILDNEIKLKIVDKKITVL